MAKPGAGVLRNHQTCQGLNGVSAPFRGLPICNLSVYSDKSAGMLLNCASMLMAAQALASKH